jgi:hypothetical protein
MINGKGFGRKQLRTILTWCHRIWLGGVMKTAETLVRIAILQSEIRSQDFLNMKKGCYILE